MTAVQKAMKDNSASILSGLAVAGVATTAYLTGKAGYTTARVLSDKDPHMGNREKVELVWKLYVPAVLSGTATVACIVIAQRTGSRKTTAAQAAFSLSERAFSEYREKVVEQIGTNKEQKIRDELAQDRVNRNPPPSQEVLVTGPGNVLCCEAHTGRYFTSDPESLKRAQNDLNAKIVGHNYAYLDDFYYLIGLQPTSHSSHIGWDSDKLMDLRFTTALTPDGRPCLVFEYNYTKPI